MKIVGKELVIFTVTIMCLVFICGALLPLAAYAADTTPPVTNSSVSGSFNSTSSWYYGSNPIVYLTATDGDSGVANTYYKMDGGQQKAYDGSGITIPEGTHTLIFWSVDNAGNSELINSYNSRTFKVDTIKPTINYTIKGTQVSGYYNVTPSLNLTANDAGGSGICTIAYSYDNNVWYDYPGRNVTLNDGIYTLYVGSCDKAGNKNNSSVSVNVFAPTIGITPEYNKWWSSDITINFDIPSSVTYVNYSFDKKTWLHSNNPSDHNPTINWEGNTTMWYMGVDTTNNRVTSINSVWYGLQKTEPTISISPSGSQDKKNGWWNGDVKITLYTNVNGPKTTQYSWDNKSWTNCSDSFTVKKGSSKTIYCRVIDSGGRTAYDHKWLYFAPGTYDQGGMSNQVYINGATTGPSSGTGTATAVPIPSTVPVPTPTQVPMPTPTYVPADTGNDLSSGSGAPLAVAVLVGVLVLLGIIAAAAYLFVFKPK